MERERQVKDIIVCENLQKSFETERGTVDVIGNVNLRIAEKELVVLFGPGQCGKTTLINCMAGLEKATAGQVTVGGKKVEGPGPDRGSSTRPRPSFPGSPLWEMWNTAPKAGAFPKKSGGSRPCATSNW